MRKERRLSTADPKRAQRQTCRALECGIVALRALAGSAVENRRSLGSRRVGAGDTFASTAAEGSPKRSHFLGREGSPSVPTFGAARRWAGDFISTWTRGLAPRHPPPGHTARLGNARRAFPTQGVGALRLPGHTLTRLSRDDCAAFPARRRQRSGNASRPQLNFLCNRSPAFPKIWV